MIYRLRDIILSFIGLIIFSPFILLIIIGLFFTQKKIFFTQLRPGKNEKPFRLVKFSTLRDIEEGENEYINQQARLTPLGKYLRKLSLDELPQLINVLKGEMSLVGPRPLLLQYLSIYTEEQRKRHLVKPGITGWAQVNGRNQISFSQKFEYDLWYIANRSHWLDIKIMLMTLIKVFKREAVYVDEKTTEELFDGTN
ncbi:MAG: sugar transferase [Bacteroidetes bacterium]|nr:sugar transferase [Bacteroidota bacterium]MCB0842400.1 sugar transferase [Bacteroidota bacterium]